MKKRMLNTAIYFWTNGEIYWTYCTYCGKYFTGVSYSHLYVKIAHHYINKHNVDIFHSKIRIQRIK